MVRLWICPFFILLIAGFSPLFSTPAAPLVLVTSNGWVTCSAGAFSAGQVKTGEVIRFAFDLPTNAPVSRGRMEGVPIIETVWEKGSVRYTQRVLVTRLGEGPLDGQGDQAVLMIQLAGQNLAPQYTNAAASLTIELNGRPLPLELRGSLVCRVDAGATSALGVLDVPGEGVAATNGLQLRFQGSMPPGTSGTMTLKIPAVPLKPGPVADRLLDLTFEDEVQRVKKFWQDPAAKTLPPPL